LSIPELSQTGRREFRHVLAAQEIELVGLQGDLGAKGLGPGADIDRVLHRIDGAMEAAAGLTAPLVCVDLGPLAEPPQATKPKPAITPEQAGLLILPTASTAPEPTPAPALPVDQALMDSVAAALAELGRRADRYSVALAFRTSLSSFAALENAILSARCPWFCVDLDTSGMLADAWDADEIFSRLGPLIRHVRARDAVRGSDRRTKPALIGQGNVDWSAMISRLDHAGFQGWITIDPTGLPDGIRAASAGLKLIKAS
jgi:sugar phosphate isomerase/epimerase